MSSSLVAIRAQSDAGMAEQKRLAERKKNLIVLIHDFLIESGYIDTASKLNSEASAITSKLTSADNIDLMMILGEFEAYYEMKFDKKPKLTKKSNEDDAKSLRPKPPISKASDGSSKKSIRENGNSSNSSGNSSGNNNNNGNNEKLPGSTTPTAGDEEGFSIQGTSVSSSSSSSSSKAKKNDEPEEKVLKPPPQYGGDPEMKQLAAIISREIYQESPNVRFEDIVRLDEAKRILCEAVQLPLRFPAIFTGILRPWRGILLHGPPGTGKTMLAKAVATECHTTFFNISASTLVSKWRGDSEKLVRVLFEVARYYSPSTIFLDEIDSILSSRNGDGQEHEASRFFDIVAASLLDEINGGNQVGGNVFVMAASNLPWDLDVAVLRRLEKRVLVPLPVVEARSLMIRKHLEGRVIPNFDFDRIAQQTDGFSGADVELLCREAAMMPVRRLVEQLESLDMSSFPPPPASRTLGLRQQVKQANQGSSSSTINSNVPDAHEILRSDPINMEDMKIALSRTRPSSDGSMKTYENWQKDYGSI